MSARGPEKQHIIKLLKRRIEKEILTDSEQRELGNYLRNGSTIIDEPIKWKEGIHGESITALQYAVYQSNPCAVEYLLGFNANPNVVHIQDGKIQNLLEYVLYFIGSDSTLMADAEKAFREVSTYKFTHRRVAKDKLKQININKDIALLLISKVNDDILGNSSIHEDTHHSCKGLLENALNTEIMLRADRASILTSSNTVPQTQMPEVERPELQTASTPLMFSTMPSSSTSTTVTMSTEEYRAYQQFLEFQEYKKQQAPRQ